MPGGKPKNALTCMEHEKISSDGGEEVHQCMWCKLVNDHCHKKYVMTENGGIRATDLTPPTFKVNVNTACYTKALANARGPNGHVKHAADTHREFLAHEAYYRRPVVQWEPAKLAFKCLADADNASTDEAKQLRATARSHVETMKTMADGESQAAKNVRILISRLEARLSRPPPPPRPDLPARTADAWTKEALVPVIKAATDATPSEKLPRLQIVGKRSNGHMAGNNGKPILEVRATPPDMAAHVGVDTKPTAKRTWWEHQRFMDVHNGPAKHAAKREEYGEDPQFCTEHMKTCKRQRTQARAGGRGRGRGRQYQSSACAECDEWDRLEPTRWTPVMTILPHGVKLTLNVSCPVSSTFDLPEEVLVKSQRAAFRNLADRSGF